MNWIVIAQLVAQYGPQGIDLAEKLWQKWSAGKEPTQADFDELRAFASVSARDRLKAQLTLAKIPLDAPQALALLALVA